MIQKKLTSILTLISSVFVLNPAANAMDGNSKLSYGRKTDLNHLDLSNPVEKSLYLAVKNGAIDISMQPQPRITEEIHQILKQMNMHSELYETPLLIFKDEGILVTDPAKLESVLSRPNQTMTSVVE